ncbi:MAG: ribosome maturation factor RimM [Cocleimonas sp.]|nr:ribosome maturation factor RimM [Cocleimonas sp.]
MPDDYILLGEISGVSGLKGWVKVFSHTSPRLQITEYTQWFLQKKGSDQWETVKLKGGKTQGKNIIALLEGVQYRDQAEALVGSTIAVSSDQLEKLSEGEYYWKDLIGLNVENTEGAKLGKIDWLFNTGSNDVITIKGKNAEGENVEHLVPYIFDDYVISVSIEDSLMVVNWDPDF